MRKYDSYKDSGIEWIGEIPSHWVNSRYRYFYFSNMGVTLLKEDVKEDGTYPVYSATETDVLFGYVDEAPVILNEGDIVIPARGNSIGHIKVVTSPSTSTQTTIYSKKISQNIETNFVKYFLQGLREHLFQFDRTAIPQITVNQVKNNPLVIPTPEEQTAIAHYLDRKTAEIDELIADKKRLLELYEEEKTAIINQAVIKGIKANVPMKDSGIEWLGEIPEHWETSPLKYLGKFINGFSFKSTDFESTGVRVLKISNIQHMRIDWSDESFINEIFYETHENFRVLENDLVFALTRPIISTGIKVALINTTEPILLNQRNSIYRPTDINVKWVYYILLSSNFIQEFDSRIDKTGQQPNISSNDIGEIKITIPIEEEQNEIISFIDSVCSEIENKRAKTQKLIDLLTEYRTALISEVVTGKIKVTE